MPLPLITGKTSRQLLALALLSAPALCLCPIPSYSHQSLCLCSEATQQGAMKPHAPTQQDLRNYISVLDRMATMLIHSNEYIEVLGFPVDANIRNGLVSVIMAGILAVLSSVFTLVAQRW